MSSSSNEPMVFHVDPKAQEMEAYKHLPTTVNLSDHLEVRNVLAMVIQTSVYLNQQLVLRGLHAQRASASSSTAERPQPPKELTFEFKEEVAALLGIDQEPKVSVRAENGEEVIRVFRKLQEACLECLPTENRQGRFGT